MHNDIYSVKVKLSHPIPEYLPIRGKKAKVYYHGILPFCSNCHTIGHQTNACANPTANWWSYIEKLRSCDIPLEFFGSWVTNSFQTSTPNRTEANIKAQFLSFMQEFVKNPSSSNQGSPKQTPPANRFEPLFKFSPQLQASIDKSKKSKPYKNKKKEKAEPQPDPSKKNPGARGGRGGQGGRGGRGGRGGGRGRGAGAGAIAAN